MEVFHPADHNFITECKSTTGTSLKNLGILTNLNLEQWQQDANDFRFKRIIFWPNFWVQTSSLWWSHNVMYTNSLQQWSKLFRYNAIVDGFENAKKIQKMA